MNGLLRELPSPCAPGSAASLPGFSNQVQQLAFRYMPRSLTTRKFMNRKHAPKFDRRRFEREFGARLQLGKMESSPDKDSYPMANEEKSTSSAVNPQEKQYTDFELIVRGEHSDAFAILGPHWVNADGKRSLAIRVFRPNAAEVTVIGNRNKDSFAARQIHAEGLFEAILPAPVFGVEAGGYGPTDRVSPPHSIQRRQRARNARSLCISSGAHRIRFVSFRRRHALPEIRKAGRARSRSRRRSRRAFRRLGAQRETRQRRRQFQFLGRPRISHAPSRRKRHLGNLYARAWTKEKSTNSKFSAASEIISG